VFDRHAHFEPWVAGLELKFDFTAVPVRQNPVADHQTQGSCHDRARHTDDFDTSSKSRGCVKADLQEFGVDRDEGKDMKIFRIPLVIALVVVAGRTINTEAQTVETNFCSLGNSPTDGNEPAGGLFQAGDGNFYGTAENGGTSLNCGSFGCGTIFRVSPSGTYINLRSFNGFPTDGTSPQATLIQGTDGNLYGTANQGGVNGFGTVFRFSLSGNYTNLYSFGNSSTDGASPQAPLVQGSDGNFYGTTFAGGTNQVPSGGRGTVFRISPSGVYTSLYSFAGAPKDGSFPQSGLIQGSDGNFYGATGLGGPSANCADGCGTVFRISPSGIYTNLHNFTGFPTTDGSAPSAALVQGSDGNFYGTAASGGTNGFGTLFRISPSGIYTTLYTFAGSPDGSAPGGLVQGSDGNVYGTTGSGGTFDAGTLFRISPSGIYSNLYSFSGAPDGYQPVPAIMQGTDGSFYGTTDSGGTNNAGAAFKLTVTLKSPPYPINQITNIHVVATNIVVTIPSIAGETYQLQFSGSMTPTNWVNIPGASVTNSIGSLLTLTNFAGASQPKRFYRFDITP
jgi:uncharacterized repeat protein (TIGR03803 family)